MGSSVRRLAEHCRRIAIAQAPGEGQSAFLRWGSETGEPEATAVLACEGESVTIAYRWRVPAGNAQRQGEAWRTERQTIRLKFDVPYRGGARRFWRCPTCGLGARKVFDPGDGRFSCKRCLRLAYRSQRLRPWPRALARALKVRGYLASNSTPADPFPERLRGMRKRTYAALRDEIQQLENLPVEAWTSDGRHVALGIRRGTMGASKRRWWPACNAESRAERRPGHGG